MSWSKRAASRTAPNKAINLTALRYASVDKLWRRYVFMKIHHCVTKLGEHFTLNENESGEHICPVCGSAELESPAYDSEGLPSFQMCSCGFEYGYDDTPLASSNAVEGIENNWDMWRIKVIKKASYSKSTLTKCETNLKNIGITLAFDLIPVKSSNNT